MCQTFRRPNAFIITLIFKFNFKQFYIIQTVQLVMNFWLPTNAQW